MAKRRDERICCEKCGSTMFAESRFRQYIKVPPSLPGGEDELSLLDNEGAAWDYERGAPHLKGIRALTCICGQPVRLGPMRRRVPGDHASFEKSFEMAVRHQGTLGSQAIAEKLSVRFAGKEQNIALAELITRMEKIVQALRRRKKG